MPPSDLRIVFLGMIGNSATALLKVPLGAGLQVSAMVWGFAVGLQPYLIVPDVTVSNAAAPRSVLWPVLTTLSLGMVLLIPSFAFLYRVFDRARRRG